MWIATFDPYETINTLLIVEFVSEPEYILGIDIGTSSTKSVLFDLEGREMGKRAIAYPLYAPVPGVAEQEPAEIFAAVVQTVRRVIVDHAIQPQSILALSFSAAMHSVIAIDASGHLLTRCFTWADNRSAKWAQAIRQTGHGFEIYQRTGTPIHSMSPLVKLVWLRQEHPDIFAQADKFIGIKEYVLYRMFQRFVVDTSIASATGLLNLATHTWDELALTTAAITTHHLPELVPPTEISKASKTCSSILN